jgi:hypothetical protein
MMSHSESLAGIGPALAAAFAEVENATKNAKANYGMYVNLAGVLDEVRPVFGKHGVAVVQMPTVLEGRVVVETMLVHKSGEWIRGEVSAVVPKADPQSIGSAITYLRRYALAAVCGVAQEDDDGQGASQPAKKPEPRDASRKQEPKRAEAQEEPKDLFTPAQVARLRDLLKSPHVPEGKRASALRGIDEGRPASWADQWIEWAERTHAEGEKRAAAGEDAGSEAEMEAAGQEALL